MADAARQATIASLVERFLRQSPHGPALADYLTTIDADLRDEVAARCQDAAFIERFFANLPPLRLLPPMPVEIAGCRFDGLIGEGAMGKVFRARQTELGRDVAIKLVKSDTADHTDFLTRLRDEARVLASLDHPGIVKVLFCGEQDGWLYFAMDLVAGKSLADTMPSLLRQEGGKAPRRFDRAVRIVAESLEALAYAHRQGIVHRDVKPSNIVLDADEHPKLVDFGLAKGSSSPQRTRAGQLVGTPAYMSPELVARRAHDRFGPDLWAVGVILFQALTGRLPYDGANTDEVLQQLLRPIAQDPRRLTPDVPNPLAAICARALSPDPALRYRSAAAFAADLRRFLAGEAIDGAHLLAWPRLQRHLWRRRYAYAAAAALTVVATSAWLGAEARADRRRATLQLEETSIGANIGTEHFDALAHKAATARRLIEDPALTAEQRGEARRRLAAIEAEGRRRHTAGGADVVRGAGSPRGTPAHSYRAPSLALQAAGMRQALEATVIVRELPPPATLVETTWPVLQIAAPQGGGSPAVRVDAIDPITGQVVLTVENGVAPCEFAVPIGQYRIVVGDANAFAECSRTVVAPGLYPVVPILVATGNAHQGMQSIAAGSALIGQETAGAVVYAQQTATHPAFFIDRTEVTCGEFHAFCLATQAAMPRTWDETYDPTWANLPVVGVTAQQARAYAEWRGKRLPTWTEWQVAARGPTGFLYPWGNEAERLAKVATVGRDPSLPWHLGVLQIDTAPDDTSWCGAVDMLGNADEWLDTPYVAHVDGVPSPVYAWRIRGGSSWDHKRDQYARLDTISPGQPEAYVSGFRCAKSASP